MNRIYTVRNDTQKYTQKDILLEIKECVDMLQEMGYLFLNEYTVNISKDLGIHTLGSCRRLGRNIDTNATMFLISINYTYLRNSKPNEVHNTIMHEVIHSIPGCYNHGQKWKSIGKQVCSRYTDYIITRVSTSENEGFYNAMAAEGKYKYKIVCEKCGATGYMARATATLSACRNGKAKCRKCHGTKFTVIDLKQNGRI